MAQREMVEQEASDSYYGRGRIAEVDVEEDDESDVPEPTSSRRREQAERATALARKLGWFSLGLGAAELAMPGVLAKVVLGRDDAVKRMIVRGLGVREVATGIGLLSKPSNRAWALARFAGRAMDLAVLGLGARSKGANATVAAIAAAGVLGVAALDVRTSRAVRRTQPVPRARYDVSKSIIINCTPEAAYEYWRDVENLPTFMTAVSEVEALDDRRSHWSLRSLAGIDLSWDAEITHDFPNERIAWRTLSDAPLPSAGEVRFIPLSQGRGTEVRLRMQYDESSRRFSKILGKLFAKGLGFQMGQDLRRFKQLLEVGEIVESDASLHLGPHPARPAKGGAR